MRKFQLSFIFLFFVFLALPVVSIALFGGAGSYGRFAKSSLPSAQSFFAKHKARKQAADHIFQASPMKKAAISAKGELTYALGAVNTNTVISGEGDWLFVKAQFEPYRCENRKHLKRGLERLEVIASVAEISDIEVLFSISPNKYSIYPDKSGALGVNFSDCYHESLLLVRDTIANYRAQNVILFHSALEKARADGMHVFRENDTHWTSAGGLYALAALSSHYLKDDLLSYLRTQKQKPEKNASISDMGNSMLLISRNDFDSVPSKIVVNKVSQRMSKESGRMLAIHDSFFAGVRPTLSKFFPKLRTNHFAKEINKLRTSLATHDNVLVNLVERNIFKHIQSSALGWNSPLGKEILKRNAAIASGCFTNDDDDWLSSYRDKLQMVNITENKLGNVFVPTNTDPVIAADISGINHNGVVCVEVDMAIETNSTFGVFMANKSWPGSGPKWVPGRSIEKRLKAGSHKVQLLLPIGEDDDAIRIDPIDKKQSFIINGIKIKPYKE